MALTRPLLSQLNTNITSFSDNMMIMNAGNVANRDIGTIYDRSLGSVANVAMVWQESRQAFTFAYTTSTGLTNANIVVSSNANISVGNVFASSYFYSNGSAFSGGGGTPGGSSGQLQYNNLGTFAGATGATFNGTNVSVTGFNVNNSATVGTTLGVTGNISGSGVTLTGSLTARGPGDFDGGLQSTPIGNAAPSTALFTTIGASGNATVSALTVNATATIGTTLGVTGNINIGNVAGVTWANTAGPRVFTFYNNAASSLDTVFL